MCTREWKWNSNGIRPHRRTDEEIAGLRDQSHVCIEPLSRVHSVALGKAENHQENCRNCSSVGVWRWCVTRSTSVTEGSHFAQIRDTYTHGGVVHNGKQSMICRKGTLLYIWWPEGTYLRCIVVCGVNLDPRLEKNHVYYVIPKLERFGRQTRAIWRSVAAVLFFSTRVYVYRVCGQKWAKPCVQAQNELVICL